MCLAFFLLEKCLKHIKDDQNQELMYKLFCNSDNRIRIFYKSIDWNKNIQ